MKSPADDHPLRRKAAIMQALQDQLDSNDTPEVNEHYARLRSLGYADKPARELMATVLAVYLWHMMQGDTYTYADFVAQLAQLPELDLQDTPA